MKQIIKKQLLFLIGIMFCGVMTAQAQRFADDILLHECNRGYSIKPKISVADNGWIYVLMNKCEHSTEKDEIAFFCSKDGGITFEKIFNWNFIDGTSQAGMDFVVTGNDASNIAIWFVYALNKAETQTAEVYVIKFNADASDYNTKYFKSYDNSIANDVAISTNARSPEDAWSPFALGVAVSYNTKTGIIGGYIDYFYSLDGGASFTRKSMCGMEGSKFGNVDISMGQALEVNYLPRIGIVFEMDKESEENIGFVAAMANGNSTTDFLRVNKKTQNNNKTKQPKIQWLCNNAIDEPYNFMIAYSDLYNGNDWDIIKIYPLSGYNLDNHTLDNLDWLYIAASETINEEFPDLAYDKNENKYHIVYRMADYDNNNYKLAYKVQDYTNIAGGSNSWAYIGDVSSGFGDRYYFPVLDIDPTRNKACFAFQYHYGGSIDTQLFFDSEWSVGIETHEIVAKDMNVYPNPASNLINVISENANELITISDLSGKVVYSERASEKQNSIDISNLSAGMYIVRIGDKATKFVKE